MEDCPTAACSLLPAALLLLAACAPMSEPVRESKPAPMPAPLTPPAGDCAADPARCAEARRKLDERLRPPAERVHPAGETPPTRAPDARQ